MNDPDALRRLPGLLSPRVDIQARQQRGHHDDTAVRGSHGKRAAARTSSISGQVLEHITFRPFASMLRGSPGVSGPVGLVLHDRAVARRTGTRPYDLSWRYYPDLACGLAPYARAGAPRGAHATARRASTAATATTTRPSTTSSTTVVTPPGSSAGRVADVPRRGSDAAPHGRAAARQRASATSAARPSRPAPTTPAVPPASRRQRGLQERLGGTAPAERGPPPGIGSRTCTPAHPARRRAAETGALPGDGRTQRDPGLLLRRRSLPRSGAGPQARPAARRRRRRPGRRRR